MATLQNVSSFVLGEQRFLQSIPPYRLVDLQRLIQETRQIPRRESFIQVQ